MTPEELAAIEWKVKWFAGGNIKAQDLIDLVDGLFHGIPRLLAHIKEQEERIEELERDLSATRSAPCACSHPPEGGWDSL